MRAGPRLALYGLLLVALFVTSAVLADALIPAAWVTDWSGGTGPGH